jgi:xanthine dehydrogenase accessory factor
MTEVFEELVGLLRQGRPVALASIISTSGSTPRGPGARMIVTADGEIRWTIGGGGFEAAVAKDAKDAISSGKSLVKEYDLCGEGEGGTGMICGGRAIVVIDVVSPRQRLVIFGAGHVGRALAETACGLELAISVVDDRPECLSPESFPAGVTLFLTSADYDKDVPILDRNTFAAIVTRSHESDLKALRCVLQRETAYVGMIGSKRKVSEVFKRLKADGIPTQALERVHAPIGLDIGSKTPKEVAISVLAEIVKLRNTGRKAVGSR